MLGGKRNAIRIEAVKHTVNMSHGRPRCKWEDTKKMNLKEREHGGVE